MANPTMRMPGYHFIAASLLPGEEGQVIRGCQFRGADSGFELNRGTPERPVWCPCGEPVGIPEAVQLNYAVLDGNGARPA